MSPPVLCDHHKLMKHLLGLMNLGHTVFWMLWQLIQVGLGWVLWRMVEGEELIVHILQSLLKLNIVHIEIRLINLGCCIEQN